MSQSMQQFEQAAFQLYSQCKICLLLLSMQAYPHQPSELYAMKHTI